MISRTYLMGTLSIRLMANMIGGIVGHYHNQERLILTKSVKKTSLIWIKTRFIKVYKILVRDNCGKTNYKSRQS